MEISDKNFDEKVLNAETPVLVEFWASWCPPCHTIKKILKKLGSEDTGYQVMTINTDRNLKSASKYNVKGLPCFMLFKKGELVHLEVGAKSENQIRMMISDNL